MYEETSIEDASKNVMSIIVRCIGLFLLLAGLWVAVQVLLEALELYRKPQHIERFAVAIEKGSNIDKSLVSIRNQVAGQEGEESTSTVGNRSNDIRVSYFFAWIIALLLLLLVGRISLTAIKTGGELVLYDMQIKQFARMLAKETLKVSR